MGKPCPDPSILTREFLYQAYCVEGRFIRSIAREVKCRNGTIIELLREYGLAKQSPKKEWLVEHYVTLHETTDDMAIQLGCSEPTVREFLRKFEIPIHKRGKVRLPSLNSRDWLYEQYVTRGVSCYCIAEELGCNVSSVHRAMVRFTIPMRSRGDTPPAGKHVSRRVFTHHKRQLIHRRDGHVCQWPGCGSASNLETHHIIPVRNHGTNDLNNGITLCDPCHKKTLGRELQLAPMFQSIIATKSGAAHLVSTPIQLRLFA